MEGLLHSDPIDQLPRAFGLELFEEVFDDGLDNDLEDLPLESIEGGLAEGGSFGLGILQVILFLRAAARSYQELEWLDEPVCEDGVVLPLDCKLVDDIFARLSGNPGIGDTSS